MSRIRPADFGTDPDALSRSLRRSYESFRLGKRVGALDRRIVQSWKRSAAAGIDPDHQSPPQLHDPEQVHVLRDHHRIAPFVPMLQGFLDHLVQVETQMFVIADASGEMLWRFGSPRALATADLTGFREGAGWAEADVGTNAIGLAIRTRQPSRVFSAEHFVSSQHDFVCMAAPVVDPETDELLAVLNLTGPFRRSNAEAMSFVQVAASLIQEKLRLERRERDAAAREELLAAGVSESAFALVSPGGRVVYGNSDAVTALGGGIVREDAHLELPNGETLRGEFRGDYLLLAPSGRQTTHRARVELLFLGPQEPAVAVNSARRAITVRRAEILYLLAVAQTGLTADEIATRIYGDDGLAGTARSEMHRIRAAMSGTLDSAPYRFASDVDVACDALAVKDHLRHDRVGDALRAYPGPLLPRATSFEVGLLRDELHEAMRRAVVASPDPEHLSAWVHSDLGSSDPGAIQEQLRRVRQDSAEAAVLRSRLTLIDRALA